MRVPQVSERIKEAPAQALRGVFAGIGQLLLVTDKLRHKTPAGAGVPRTRTPEPAETPTAAPAAANEAAEPPAVADVVAVEAVPAEPVVAEPVAAKPLVAEPAAAPPLVAEPVATEPLVAEPVAAKPAAAKPVPAEAARATARKPAARDFDKTGNVRLLEGEEDAEAAAATAVAADVTPPPLPNYDELSIASLRARLRNLDLAQLKQAADYERAHQARAEVMAMFERRTAKLELEAGA